MTTDPIADMLTRLRNATAQRFLTTKIPVSRLKTAIAQILAANGWIEKYELITPELIIKLQPHIKIEELRNEILNYESDDDSVTDFDTVSRRIS
jgi:small subunit ribosomal protein S8